MKILIIGIGSIAQRHIKIIKSYDPSFKIYALRSSKNSIKIAGVIDFFDLKEINFKPNFIIISNPTALHEKSILDCFSFNCPLFIEKPVLSNFNNANKIKEIINKNKIITYVACNMRFNGALLFLKNNLSKLNLRINEINIYCGSYLPSWRPNSDFRKSYSSFSEMGGGVHLDLIHEIDYCIWLFGNPNSVRSIKRSNSSLKINSVDYSKFDLEYDTFNASINLNYFRRDSKRELEIISQNDTLIVDLLNNSIYSKVQKIYIYNEEFNINDSYKNQFSYFIDCIKSKKDTFNNFEYGLNVLKIALND